MSNGKAFFCSERRTSFSIPNSHFSLVDQKTCVMDDNKMDIEILFK